jgi:hypothetical protein
MRTNWFMISIRIKISLCISMFITTISCNLKESTNLSGPSWIFDQLAVSENHILVFNLDKCHSCLFQFREEILLACKKNLKLIILTSDQKKAKIFLNEDCLNYQILKDIQIIDSLKMDSSTKIFSRNNNSFNQLDFYFPDELYEYLQNSK